MPLYGVDAFAANVVEVYVLVVTEHVVDEDVFVVEGDAVHPSFVATETNY